MRRIGIFGILAFGVSGCGSNGDFDAVGTFEATEVTVSAEASGRILSFPIREGDWVDSGEKVGTIDTVQLHLQKLQLACQAASARNSRPDIASQVSALRAQIAQQGKERKRIENLLADGAATAKQLDDVNAQLEILGNQLEALLSSLEKNTASIEDNVSSIGLQIAQLEDKLAKSRIVSPIGGVVLEKYAEPGELAAVGRPLMKVADMRHMYLRAYFTSDQLADLEVGKEVRVTADFGGNRQYAYPGRIVWISAESEFTPKSIQTRNSRANLVYAVKIAVENDGRLKVGLYGEVELS